MKFKHVLCWIRRDLRLSDHRSIFEACKASAQVSVVFIYDTTILGKLKDSNDKRVSFIYESVNEVNHKLCDKGSALIILCGDPKHEIPSLAKSLSADAVFCNRDYEPLAKKRDDIVAENLKFFGIGFRTFKDQVIYEGLEVTTQPGGPFRVFTPYKRAWLKRLTDNDIRDFRPNFRVLSKKIYLKPFIKNWPLNKIGFKKADLSLEAGEKAGNRRLTAFLKKIDYYDKDRDQPSLNGTSGLSVHLRFGTISIRKLVRSAMNRDSKGAEVWLSELIWRDFYHMILDRFPRVTSSTFNLQYNKIEWPGSNKLFLSWCKGKTGYPLIDAAMRHFNNTGWMHNRLRMIVASFLVKDLLVDWRKGEAYFSRFLLDFDLAANNGGWQWCASTGCDAQPWFRIFNPITQSKRYDPEGDFIRSILPELAGFSNKDIHFPSDTNKQTQLKAGCLIGKDYPKPIVDHSIQRAKALQLFKNNKIKMGN